MNDQDDEQREQEATGLPMGGAHGRTPRPDPLVLVLLR